MSPAAVTKPKHVVLYDMTRQRSHLFFRYLSTHPDIESMWHPILGPFSYGPERLQVEALDITEDDVPPEHLTYQDAIDSIYKAKELANSQGKMLVMNEHSQLTLKHDVLYAIRDGKEIPDLPNPTVLPDDMIRDAFPIFVIRNPVFSVPSNYVIFKATSTIRPGDFSWNVATGSNLQRMLFDKIKAQHGQSPLVVDGDDVVWRPEEVSDAVCRALGLDGELSDTWEPVPKEKRHWSSSIRMFLQMIDDSTGIQRATGDRPDTDIDKAYAKWKDEYGEEAANGIKETVERNREHYEYLKQFKV